MIFSIPAAAWSEALASAKAAAPRTHHLPILHHVHLDACEAGTVTWTTTDLDIAVSRTVLSDCRVIPGTTCLPLAELARIRPDKDTSVRVDLFEAGRKAEISYIARGTIARVVLLTLSPAEFPLPEPPGKKSTTHIVGADFLPALASTLHAVSADETRYVLCGTYLDPLDGGYIVATDGRRLALARCRVMPRGVILPTKAVRLLLRLPAQALRVTHDPGTMDRPARLLVQPDASVRIWTRLIDGNFPNWRQVVPTSAMPDRITFSDPAAVTGWLRGLGKKPSSVRIQPATARQVEMTVHDPNVGESTARFTAYIEGQPPIIAFNPAFFADAIENIGGTLHFTDPMSPAVLKNGHLLAVLMPMRVIVSDTKMAEATAAINAAEAAAAEATPEAQAA